MRTQRGWKEVDEKIGLYLGLKYHLVGIRMQESEIKDERQLRPEKPKIWCQGGSSDNS